MSAEHGIDTGLTRYNKSAFRPPEADAATPPTPTCTPPLDFCKLPTKY